MRKTEPRSLWSNFCLVLIKGAVHRQDILKATVGHKGKRKDKAVAGAGSLMVPGGKGAEVRKQT